MRVAIGSAPWALWLWLWLEAMSGVPIAKALSFGGYCTRCGTHHVLPTTEAAREAAVDLRDRMVRSGRIDIDELSGEHRRRLLVLSNESNDDEEKEDKDEEEETIGNPIALELGLDPSLAIERLYERRGKMFGVLVCEDPSGGGNGHIRDDDDDDNNNNNNNNSGAPSPSVVVLKAYAGKLGGEWNLPGWAPLVGRVPETIPEFNVLGARVTALFREIERETKRGESTGNDDAGADRIRELKRTRAALSARAIERVREHQLLTNARGETLPIEAAFCKGPSKLPGGTGDCAAPKLLAEAMRRGLRPTGICEIFVGATGGMSTTKKDGVFYDACEPRCQQIAGFMLCGLEVKGDVEVEGESEPEGGEGAALGGTNDPQPELPEKTTTTTTTTNRG